MEQEVDPELPPPMDMDYPEDPPEEVTEGIQPIKKEITMPEAIEQVTALVSMPLESVDQTDLGPSHLTLHHSANFDAKLQDRLGFNTGIKRFQDLADARANLVRNVFSSSSHVNNVFPYF